MVLRLVNALDVPLLFVVQISMNVLLQDFEITRHGVQRRAKLVTETREQLGLNAICGFCLLAGALLALECQGVPLAGWQSRDQGRPSALTVAQGRSLTSLPAVTPKMCFAASAAGMCFPIFPITTTNSAS